MIPQRRVSSKKASQSFLRALSSVNTSHHITSHHITSHHITSHHITSHHITSHHNTTQHNTTQHNTTQHNTTQHNTTQYISQSVLLQNYVTTSTMQPPVTNQLFYPSTYAAVHSNTCIYRSLSTALSICPPIRPTRPSPPGRHHQAVTTRPSLSQAPNTQPNLQSSTHLLAAATSCR